MGRLRIDIEVGPAFRGNAVAALQIAADRAPEGPSREVYERLRDGVGASSFYPGDGEKPNPDEDFTHLDVNDTPQTAAEAFWMAAQWGHRWSHWNEHHDPENTSAALVACAQHDAAEASKLVAIGTGLTIREQLGASVGAVVDALAGIEDRLSDVRQGMPG